MANRNEGNTATVHTALACHGTCGRYSAISHVVNNTPYFASPVFYRRQLTQLYILRESLSNDQNS